MPSWDVASPDGTYDPKKHYTAASDRRGHFAQIRVNFPTTIAAQIAKIVQGGFVPEYETNQDLVRDLVTHGLHAIQQKVKSGELERALTMHILYSDAVARSHERQMYDDMMRAMETEYDAMVRAGQREQAAEWALGHLSNRRAVPGTYREDFIDRLQRMVKNAGGVLTV